MAIRDLVVACRTLGRSPVFACTTALTIALGVGATTAIFSVANAVLLRPLPYRDPGRLVVLYSDLRARNNLSLPFSAENYTDTKNATAGAFDDMAAVLTVRQVLPGADGSPEQVRLGFVTTNFFPVMGAGVVAGRDFEERDGLPQQAPRPGEAGARTPDVPLMAIVSHEYWQRRYGGDRSIVGQGIAALGPAGLQIVGVLAPGFELLFPPGDNVDRKPDIWVANRLTYDNANRNGYGLRPIGRLKAGISLARAQDDVEAASATIRRDFPLYATANYYARVEPMHRSLVSAVRPAILSLLGAALFLLLIASANVANLLLVRASLRQTELAVRSALGADRSRLLRQLLAEALVIAVLGTIGGIALAWMGIGVLVAAAPANVPRLGDVGIDWMVMAFALAAGVGAALLSGLAPAWTGVKLDVMTALRGSSRTEGLGRGSRLRHAAVVLQVALCFALLIGSGLMLRSFVALQRIDPGFDPDGVLTFQLLGGRGGPPPQRAVATRELRDRLTSLPGVQSVTASFPFPLAGDFSTIRWGTEEALADNSRYQAVDWQRVLPGYFETMRTRLVAGRTFTEADNDPRAGVVVVDQVLAAKAFPAEPAVGKRILIRIRTPEPEWVEIIGVVAHQRLTTLAEAGREQVYFTDGFLNFGGARKWAVRASGDPSALATAVRAEVTRVDPQLLITDMAPMQELVARAQVGTRFQLLLIGTFAVVAALLVGIGLYGVLSTVVRQRTAEIGVRMALGAPPAGVLGMVMGQGLRLSLVGMLLGVIAALGLTRLMRSMLVGVDETDPITYVAMTVAFLAIATVAAWVPARRAAALDPTEALRDQ